MAKDVEVDFDGLARGARILDELRGDFQQIAISTTNIMGHLTTACGDDHFGHKFTDGEKGFKTNGEGAVQASDAMSESFSQFTEGVGGTTGAKTALSGTDQTSGENIRRSV